MKPIGRKGKPLTNWYGDLFDGDGNYELDAHYRRKREKGRWKYVPAQTKRDLWQRDKSACVNCDTTNNLTIDHIVPVSYGGTSELSNLQLLCRRCHGQKELVGQPAIEVPLARAAPEPSRQGSWVRFILPDQ